ncbi:deoxyribodipyrimidine photo-lyase [Rhizomicrobium palustre]|uniref:Deoxyribodipyrimidine photo-lyase n=1 Tax=Rhizomicrobium palustre TaxID=189966 RepID=A0A846N3Y5_9PROT|nr:deoxyribodipyrimidine photo-lyase [Rhizomicrobium palustre]NIK90219.1 deoxyribodipyrimidine photo-lyase [Rhizomicrobium palustre]
MPTTIVVFYRDLRIADHRPLANAAARGRVVPLYVAEDPARAWAHGAASRWWLREALLDLQQRLAALGAPLLLRRGNRIDTILMLARETGAKTVVWHRRYEPDLAKEDAELVEALKEAGIAAEISDGYLLFEPDTIRTGAGTPFRVFTPFSRACLSAPTPTPPIAAPKKLESVSGPASDPLEALKLVPSRAVWPEKLASAWSVGEVSARKTLDHFLKQGLDDYAEARDRPDLAGTSRLSPYLHYGEISPRQVWHAVLAHKAAGAGAQNSLHRFQLEVLWREFSWHLLHQFPLLPEKPLNPSFTNFPWLEDDEAALLAWQKGQTGYPIVDAGMRQLWQTGWMHNRVRMIVASFLIKHLLISWQKGEAWFWDTLVDADLGANAASWQWVAGCGADAAPYFRIFNPILQGQKFDPDGAYVRRYVPELSRLDDKFLHQPWTAPASDLAKAGIVLGKNYPKPIVEHGFARKRALRALALSKGEKGEPDLFR